ncbi:Redoxin [Dentipellis sp. KUC8613]|nr:Redoxin [Dentipellis sp. KUC8613]
MASIVASAAKTAHAAAASLLEKAQIKVGEKVPTNETVKEDNPAKPITLALAGKNIINARSDRVLGNQVGVPAAFSPPCSEEVPGYIAKYDEFKARGVTDVYVVAVNDAFVTKAWKDKLAPGGTGVRFIADDQGAFVSNLGLLQDATGLLGAPRAKRFVIVAQDGVAQHLIVEPDSSVVTITAADKVLALL